MKKIRTILTLLILSYAAMGQDVSKNDSANGPAVVYKGQPFTWVQQMPSFPGGDEKLFEYFSQHINRNAVKPEINGRLTVRFIVDENGNVTNAVVPKGMGLGGGCDEEAIRVIMSSPAWTPGKQNGHAVPVWMTFPVVFGNYPIPKADTSLKKTRLIAKAAVDDKGDSVWRVTYDQEMPSFPGGEQKLLDYIHKNLRYPQAAREAGLMGQVSVRFVVDAEGNVKEAAVVKGKGMGAGCDEEAVRVVMSMPKWSPGKQNGKPVPVLYTVPVIFML